jgi:co-chaperonin GroES (HSP10)
MRSLHDFFVRMPKAFNDELKIGDKSIYLDPKWNEFENRKMSAKVYSVPEKYNTGVKPGDTLYFHHHVVVSNEGKGQLVDDDIYFVRFDPHNSGNTQAYAYKCQDTGEIHLLSEWIFLTPEEQEDEEVTESGIITELKKPEYNMFGYVLYDSPAVQELGLKKGDKVMIMKNADYRMKIDGEEVYRTHITHIYATGF